MPPDVKACVNKFLPNNPVVANVVLKVLKNAYQTHILPMPMVKQVVERALEQSRTLDMKVESAVFEERLSSYANQLRGRYKTQLADIRNRGKKW
jgi:hypothetical protein